MVLKSESPVVETVTTTAVENQDGSTSKTVEPADASGAIVDTVSTTFSPPDWWDMSDKCGGFRELTGKPGWAFMVSKWQYNGSYACPPVSMSAVKDFLYKVPTRETSKTD